jgi:hypothetical protein
MPEDGHFIHSSRVTESAARGGFDPTLGRKADEGIENLVASIGGGHVVMNDWMVDRDVDDLECAPRKTALSVRTASLGAELSISFQRADPELVLETAIRIARAGEREMKQRMQQQLATAPPEFRAHVLETLAPHSPEELGERSARFLLDGVAVEDSALCVIEGTLRWPVEIALEPTRIVLPRQNVLSGGVAKNSQVGIQIS